MTFCKEKTKGYKDDLQTTTHPVSGLCQDTDMAEEILDGITYGKGACFVRQLLMRIGIDTFLQGCKSYFAQYCWRNTTLDDFIKCMQQEHEPNSNSLTEFSNKWLTFKGVNSFTFTVTDTQLTLTQGFMEFADHEIKEQMVNVLAILSEDFQEKYLFENVLISGENPDTVIEIPPEH